MSICYKCDACGKTFGKPGFYKTKKVDSIDLMMYGVGKRNGDMVASIDIWCGIIMIGVLSFTILLLAITLNMVSDALRENIAVLEKKVANIEAADATISTINGVDYYTFDHDGQHYVVEVG